MPALSCPARRLLLILSSASGVVTVVYQVLYAQAVQLLLGSTVNITITTLATFLLAVALGAFWSRRLVRWLWLTELALGALALLFGLAFRFYPELLVAPMSALPLNAGARIVAAVGLMTPPALLAGISVPGFTIWLKSLSGRQSNTAFNIVYGLYHLSAAIAVLAISYVALPTIGMSACMCLAGLSNIAVGLCLHRVQRYAPAPVIREHTVERGAWRRYARVYWPLFAAGILSGVAQSEFLVWVNALVSPLAQNLSAAIALSMLGMAIGAGIVHSRSTRRNVMPFAWFCLACAGIMAVTAWSLPSLAAHAGSIKALFGTGPVATLPLILALGIGLYVAIGGLVPAFYARPNQASEVSSVSVAIAASGLGNAIGFVLFVGFISVGGPDLWVILLVVAGFALLGAQDARQQAEGASVPVRSFVTAIVIVCLVSFACAARYRFPVNASILASRLMTPAHDTASGAVDWPDLTQLRQFRWGLTRDAVMWDADDTWRYVLSGYVSLTYRGDSMPAPETAIAALPALYAANQDKALVIGIGSGTTTSAATSFYSQVEAVDVDPSWPDIVDYFSRQNDDLADKASARLINADAFAYLWHVDGNYDSIVMSPTAPSYLGSYTLYSREFYELSAAHLRPGGVFVSWVDIRFDPIAIKKTLHTLQSVFSHVRMVPLQTGYYAVLASDQSLDTAHALDTRRPRAKVRDALRRFLDDSDPVQASEAAGASLAEAVNAVSFEAPRHPDVAINRLDRADLPFHVITVLSASSNSQAATIAASNDYLVSHFEAATGIDMAAFYERQNSAAAPAHTRVAD